MISVVIPVYNIKKYVSYAVCSVLAQTFQNWEVYLVDDGSTDGSAEVCDALAVGDKRIRVIHKSNGGLSSARNVGIKNATGEWVILLDGDDYLHPETLKTLQALVYNHPDLDFIQFLYKEVHEYEEKFENVSSADLEIVTSEREMFERLFDMGGIAASACTKFYRRSLFDKLSFKEGILHEDEEFTTRLLTKVDKVGYTNSQFYYYVMRPGSIIHTVFTPKRMMGITVVEDRITYLNAQGYQELVEKNRSRLLSSLALYYHDAGVVGCTKEQNIISEKFRCEAKLGSSFVTGRVRLLCYLSRVANALKWYDKIYNSFKFIQQKLSNARTKVINKYNCWKERQKLKNKNFTIISNNCWGGLIYQHFGLPYTSPTVGLFIMDDDYIKFLEHIDYYISQPLHFIPFESSRYHDYLSRESTAKEMYPIALLDDVEVHFMHYHSEEEARIKWERRCKRINKDRILFKMSQRYIHGNEILDRFAALPFKNKICFTEEEYLKPGFVKIPELKELNIQGGDETSYVLKAVDIVKVINNMQSE